MPDKKLTDNEIIQALDICSKSTNGCSHSKYTCKNCYLNGQPMCSSVLLQDAIDYFNRLQEENNKYNKIKELLDMFWNVLLKIGMAKQNEECFTLEEFAEALQDIQDKAQAKAEAYKECIEKVKEKLRDIAKIDWQDNYYYLIGEAFFDNLLREMIDVINKK